MRIKPGECALDDMRPNSWNYNVQDAFIFAKEVNSIRKYGFVDPITVRNAPAISRGALNDIAARLDELGSVESMADATKEICDGEHRWKALLVIREGLRDGTYSVPDDLKTLTEEDSESRAGEWVHPDGSPLATFEVSPDTAQVVSSGMVPISDLGECPTSVAKRFTVLFNEIKGSPDYEALSRVVASLAQEGDVDGLLEDLPFTEGQFEGLLREMEEEDLQDLFKSPAETDEEEDVVWIRVEAIVTKEVHALYSDAYESISRRLAEDGLSLHADPVLANGQIIEVLTAEYLADPNTSRSED